MKRFRPKLRFSGIFIPLLTLIVSFVFDHSTYAQCPNTENFNGGSNTSTPGNPFAATFNTFDFTGTTLSANDAFFLDNSSGFAQITGNRLNEITLELNAGGSFKLDEIIFEVGNLNTVDDNITVRGYSSNSFVTGATTTFTVPGAFGAETIIDFTGIPEFGDIDEVRIEIADDGSFGGIRIESVTIACAVPLPVEMAYFEAEAEGREVLLEWATYSELNNKGFYIQRKVEADWQEIAFVAGQDQSNQSQEYQFTDQAPAGKGHFVYRLAQEDWDGSRSYTDQIEVNLGAYPMTLYPSPNDGSFKLDLGASYQQVQLRFLGIDGKVLDKQHHRNIQHIEMQSDLAPGFYLLEIQADSSPTQTLKLVIE